MSDKKSQIDELENRLDRLIKTQIDFQKEITTIRSGIESLRKESEEEITPYLAPKPAAALPSIYTPLNEAQTDDPFVQKEERTPNFGFESNVHDTWEPDQAPKIPDLVRKHSENARADLEKFIGENLISKIGILILIIGVGIGVKYSIDNDLISPLTRVILAYVMAFGLTGLAIKLKAKYHNFSAALLSGGMAIMYFVTYFAFAYYGLIGQLPTFALMVMLTVLTVTAALVYNRQVIAHIGLVGAYAVPFLLSSDSGNYIALFGYMTVINIGILAVSLRKYWVSLFYTSSVFTWMIFCGWLVTKYSYPEHFNLALSYLAVFAGIFLLSKFVHKEFFAEEDDVESLVGLQATIFIFFGVCFVIRQSDLALFDSWKFFSYIAIASAVLIAASFRHFGKAILYVVTPFMWLIFGDWIFNRFSYSEHFTLATTFVCVFFALIYLSGLLRRLIKNDFDMIENAGFILVNSFISYGFGYWILNSGEATSHLLGIYTVANSGLHLTTAFIISRIRADADDVVYALTVLILTFASIAVPIQFNGNLVTMIWSVEAAILFWLGRTKGIKLFEYFSFPVMALAAGSMFLDWVVAYKERANDASEFDRELFVNGEFITAIVLFASFIFIYLINRDPDHEPAIEKDSTGVLSITVAGIAILTLYNALRIEIDNFFYLKAISLKALQGFDPRALSDLSHFNFIWQIDYTIVFLAVLGVLNLKKIRSLSLAKVTTVIGVGTVVLFSTFGMMVLSELNKSYLLSDVGLGHIFIRYISYIFVGVLLYTFYRCVKEQFYGEDIPENKAFIAFEALAYTIGFIVASFELINLMELFSLPDATKLGLSILWGAFALMLIVVGIAWKRKHLRVAAIVILSVTLIKLFFYDAADLDTIPRTILFVTLGITLLAVSFLYNKYKVLIFGQEIDNDED